MSLQSGRGVSCFEEYVLGLFFAYWCVWRKCCCCYTRTGKPLSNRLIPNKTAVSVVQVTISESLIECKQVQVDHIVQVERHTPILQWLATHQYLHARWYRLYSVNSNHFFLYTLCLKKPDPYNICKCFQQIWIIFLGTSLATETAKKLSRLWKLL